MIESLTRRRFLRGRVLSGEVIDLVIRKQKIDIAGREGTAGVSWTREFGQTADFARREGEDVETLGFVVGVRLWF
jgi:hypothetical protein